MGFRIKDALFSTNPASDGRSLWIRSCGVRNCSRRATVGLGIDTLIANILVFFLELSFMFGYRKQLSEMCISIFSVYTVIPLPDFW